MSDPLQQFQEKIRSAAANKAPLRIRGSGSKDFYGVKLEGDVLDTRGYSGIVDYEPTELVFTARAGTPLREVEAALAEKGQMLPFEPPHFGPDATFGGCIASGFSGPRRAYHGAVRDFVLGVRSLNAAGEDLQFGGQVMKNVAGYDVSRLLTGSFGTLGLILEVSVKVLPIPDDERTLRLEMNETAAIETMNRCAGQPLPLSATCFTDNSLYIRLSGAASAVSAARKQLGGETIDGKTFWQSVREQTHPFFSNPGTLWRLSMKSTAAPLTLGPTLIEWNGSLRWISGEGDLENRQAVASKAGGYATLFRAQTRPKAIQYLSPAMMALQKKIKQALDPEGLFGPHRLHAEF
ncbi:MAG: glycolate oxidase subunit GlcE [Betaproteobacteria bacterium]|nr:MAG: glycolate oxidase subunit GlcE [Betaproteobacteria bacterium]